MTPSERIACDTAAAGIGERLDYESLGDIAARITQATGLLAVAEITDVAHGTVVIRCVGRENFAVVCDDGAVLLLGCG